MTSLAGKATEVLVGAISEDPYVRDQYYVGEHMYDVGQVLDDLRREALDYIADDGRRYTVTYEILISFEEEGDAPDGGIAPMFVGVLPHGWKNVQEANQPQSRTSRTTSRLHGEVVRLGFDRYAVFNDELVLLTDLMGETTTRAFAPFLNTGRSVTAQLFLKVEALEE